MIISLTGFMGSGKSSIGRQLSKLLCCHYMDLDEVIEEKAGKTIKDIFDTEGEAAFRRMELQILHKILDDDCLMRDKENLILSLGGGTVMTPECGTLIHDKTSCIYLRATVDTLVRNLENEISGRPMLNGSDDIRLRIETLLAQRAEIYESVAHFHIDTDGKTTESITKEILPLINHC